MFNASDLIADTNLHLLLLLSYGRHYKTNHENRVVTGTCENPQDHRSRQQGAVERTREHTRRRLIQTASISADCGFGAAGRGKCAQRHSPMYNGVTFFIDLHDERIYMSLLGKISIMGILLAIHCGK
jgi:hypothetical protein